MSYKIVVDSCCDLTAEMRGWENLQVVPLSLKIADYEIFDDENFDQDDFIARMKANSGKAKSACPAPDAFKQACEGDYDEVYVLTITDKLSGTYNSALQGKMLYEEEFNDNKKIHVFNSLATSGLETIVAQEIKKLGDEGKSFDDMVSYIEDYIENHTGLYFCLDSLDALKQNGRLFALAAGLLEKIHLKLICKAKEVNISPQGKELTIN
ncbi:MAG: DegV family protein, partial [Eubacterium sp.]|nr:DegV family protein [Eubacterium sp.]